MPDPHIEIVPDAVQRDALIQAHHISMRRHNQAMIYRAREHAAKAGLTAAGFCVAVIDSEDPWMDDATYERLGGYGYQAKLYTLAEMRAALQAFEMPVSEAGLRWSHAARCWVDGMGKKSTDHAMQRPFLHLARMAMPPAQENFFLLVTFTKGAAMFVDLPDIEVPLEAGETPVVKAEGAQVVIEEVPRLPADGSGGPT